MKLKYLLASGLFLSTAFVACTNDDFAEISAPANTDNAIALGEGFTISVNKGGADTRAAFDDESLQPYWIEGDRIGAAWLHKVTGIDEYNNVTDCSYIGSSYQMFYSNLPFTLIEGAGTANGRFETVGNAFAGAYVLYYPYDPQVAMAGNEIPVALKTYEVNCADPTKNLTENMFAWSPVKFVPGGPQTDDFYLEQIPVLVQLKFKADKKLNMNLDGGVTIKNIVLMAEDANGDDVLADAGKIVAGTAPQKGNYNYVLENPTDVFNGNGLGNIANYENVGSVDHLFITAIGSEESDFQLLKEDVATVESFDFSILPLDKKAKKVTIKIVTEDRGVYKKVYDSDNSEEKKFVDEFNQAYTQGKGMGQVQMVVNLDMTETDDVIYTAEEFMRRWEAATTNGENPELEVGTDLVLTEPLTCNNESAEVTVMGHKLTVPSITIEKNTAITFENEVLVEGDVMTSGASELNATNLTAKNIEIQGMANLTIDKADVLTIASSGVVTASGVEGESAVDVINIQKGKNSIGKLTLGAKLAFNTLESEGDVILAADATNTGTMVVENLNTTSTCTLTNKGELTINGTIYSNSQITNSEEAKLVVNVSNSSNWVLNNDGEVDLNGTTSLKADSENNGTINLYANLNGTWENNGIVNVYGKSQVNATSVTMNEDSWIVLKSLDAKVTNCGTVDSNLRTAFSAQNTTDMTEYLTKKTTLGAGWLWIDNSNVVLTNMKADVYLNANVTLESNVSVEGYVRVNKEVSMSTKDNEEYTFEVTAGNWQVEGHLNLTDKVTLKGEISRDHLRNISGGNVEDMTIK